MNGNSAQFVGNFSVYWTSADTLYNDLLVMMLRDDDDDDDDCLMLSVMCFFRRLAVCRHVFSPIEAIKLIFMKCDPVSVCRWCIDSISDSSRWTCIILCSQRFNRCIIINSIRGRQRYVRLFLTVQSKPFPDKGYWNCFSQPYPRHCWWSCRKNLLYGPFSM
jgi:hypothetical protein